MKKTMTVLLAAWMAVSLAACGSQEQVPAQGVIQRPQQSETQPESQSAEKPEVQHDSTTAHLEISAAETTQPDSETNILIVYFTVPETDGVDAVASASRVVTGDGILGNTEFIASEIQKNLGGDLFAIETMQEYPGSHEPLLDFAYNEKSDNARPELSTHIENLDDYDYIFIGYPNWNADLPMPLYTFFEEYDFSGKTLIPFVTHGGSGLSGTVQTIQELEPNAVVVEAALSISRNGVQDAQDEVKTWTDSLLAD